MIEREQPTVYPAVPFGLRLLTEAPGEADLSSLRLCLSAATGLPGSTFDAFAERFHAPVRQLYGCTEAGAVTVNLDDDPYGHPGSVGRPIAGMEVRVVDAEGADLAPDRTGEILIRGAGMTDGYAGGIDLNRSPAAGSSPATAAVSTARVACS